MASNLSKTEIVNNVLDKTVKNLKPEFRKILFNILIDTPDINSMLVCKEIVYDTYIPNRRLGKKSKQYWIDRGWSHDEAYAKAKENKVPGHSVFSKDFWLSKINPVTGCHYTAAEAEFERNSRRPIRAEYWIKKGYSTDDAAKLAIETKIRNNINGSRSAAKSSIRRVSSRRCIEYFTAKGHDLDEARRLVSDGQRHFSKDICIQKYGQEEGLKIWQSRQDNWQTTLNSKSNDEKARINRLKLSKGITVSKAENTLLTEIKKVIPHVIHQFTISNHSKRQYVYDIMANNKIIEYNGDFWHSNPKMYSGDYINPRTKLSALDRWHVDSLKLKTAIECGYQVLVIWESDFKQNKQQVINQCIQFLTQ